MKACGMERYADWFFDLDGTLVDSAPDILRLLAGVLREEGLGMPEPDKRRIGPPLEDIILGLCPGLSPERLDRVVRVYRGRYRACPFDGSPAFAGIPPLFERLTARGCRLFVATNKPEDVTRRLLETRGLSPFLTGIACSDSAPGRRLSKAEMLGLLAERHGVAAEHAIMVGDSVFDMRGGREAGMDTAAVLYGYGRREALLKTEPDFVVEDAAWTRISRRRQPRCL
ncbi:HAD family hydrolase [uncultured Bilophila sp.]|uniref:HAD family hydrolase n=1 Tax=uncultured Bilophila sp. TaxID=529385 RepID=UPI0026DC5581|nr:HAD hydrolase-like protein [uncultured Bilophila sp.]